MELVVLLPAVAAAVAVAVVVAVVVTALVVAAAVVAATVAATGAAVVGAAIDAMAGGAAGQATHHLCREGEWLGPHSLLCGPRSRQLARGSTGLSGHDLIHHHPAICRLALVVHLLPFPPLSLCPAHRQRPGPFLALPHQRSTYILYITTRQLLIRQLPLFSAWKLVSFRKNTINT